MTDNWLQHFDEFMPGARTRRAICPNLKLWRRRIHEGLTFRMTQILTGHGCFAAYLHRIQKMDTNLYAHCDRGLVDTEHTLMKCPAWSVERSELLAIMGQDLSLSNIVSKMVRSMETWRAFSLFCERVIRTKEEEERTRRAAAAAVVAAVSPRAPSPRDDGGSDRNEDE